MRSNLIEDGLSLLGGVGLGAAVMYLLDPDVGRDRRHGIAHAATDAVSSGGQAIHSSVQSAADYAADAVNRMREAAGNAARDARDGLVDRASSLWSGNGKSAGAATEDSRTYARAAGITTGTIGVLALGAGLMYWFDPDCGRGRRAWAASKIFSVTRRTGRRASSYGRHVGNRLHGMAAEARRVIPRNWRSEQTETARAGAEETSMPAAPSPETGTA